MAEPIDPGSPKPVRPSADRANDHAAIDRLAAELLPALIARLGATGLGELEVREGAWRIRLRRPLDAATARERRPSGAAARAHPGHTGHGHGPVALEAHRSASSGAPSVSGNGAGNGASPPLTPVGPGQDGFAGIQLLDDGRAVATSPAVGVYQPRPDARPGTKVRAGDRIGVVDMLGVPQDVVAPVDGIVGASLVEAGEAVEYGQQLVVIEFAATPVGES
ncbi:MAG: acetyl-CoA carboxylase biotin carboxyl carrier protein [Chloroflexota bacterium]